MEKLREDIVASILRSPNPNKSSALNRSVHFEPPQNLKDILIRHVPDEIDGITTHLHNLQGEALVTWLQDLQECVPILNRKLEHFVSSMLKIQWAMQDVPVVCAFKNFLINLISAHNFYMKPVAKMLISNLIGKDEIYRDRENTIFENTHWVIKTILELCPLAGGEVLFYCKDRMPYVLSANFRSQITFAENLLKMTKYVPERRREILMILVDRVVQLDVLLPKSRLNDDNEDEEDDDDDEGEERQFNMDCDDDDDDVKSTISSRTNITLKVEDSPEEDVTISIANTNLDNLMNVMFTYLKNETSIHDDEFNKCLYFDLLNVFERLILPTWATGHVQFLIFYYVSLRPAYYGHFLDWLWKKFTNPNSPSVLRQSCVAYIGSFVARARFVNVSIAKTVLEKLVNWIQAYIRNSDGIHRNGSDFMYSDVKTHAPFYAACQSSFYVFAFRHDEFVDKRTISFLKSLNFNTIVTCHLNPLRVCLPTVVKNFASISRNYQLAYCDTIIQRNNRINLPVVGNLSEIGSNNAKPLLLDSFFPFDPYSLKDSNSLILPIYRDYKGNVDDSEDEDDETEDEEEEMEESKIHQAHQSFMYGTSPGFKH